MKIQTKFNTGDKVYFYNKGEINRGKIIHVDISANGGTEIIYKIDRNDKQYKDWWDFDKNYYRMATLYRCYHEEQVVNNFNEDEVSETKEGVLKILRRKEMARHSKELEKIENL